VDIFEKRAKDLGVTKEDLERALSKFISMLGDDELRMFLNDMSKESCCSPGSGCGCS
tara:strand:+ start:3368 stop:3538 length:171 start_codon:yes stop_codon:yes gene_type:complete